MKEHEDEDNRKEREKEELSQYEDNMHTQETLVCTGGFLVIDRAEAAEDSDGSSFFSTFWRNLLVGL